MRWAGSRILLALGSCLAPGLASCGYSVGFEPLAPGIRTVAIQVVDNLTFRQRVERDLTRSIARHLSEYTPYRIAPHDRADAILQVEIVAIRNTSIVIGGGRPVSEGALDAIARIRLRERRSGEILVDTRERDVAEYRTQIGEDESSARRELAPDLGRKIVLALAGGY